MTIFAVNSLAAPPPPWAWVGFFTFIVAMLALDLGLLRRGSREVPLREALTWCGVWLGLALAFGALLWHWRGDEAGQQFLAGYLIELCLSVDNIFVLILIFAWFKIAARYQHRVLFWGIVGAAVMRSAFILIGVSALHRFHWILYVFGAFLVYSGVKMAVSKKRTEEIQPEKNAAVRFVRRFLPVTTDFPDANFFMRKDGLLCATPLFLVLVVVETTDMIFAFDSLPAVLAVTRDSFIALTSNIFAILGLRSLYFAVSGVMTLFRFLKAGLAMVLFFIGLKMLAEPWWQISTRLSLAVIGTVLVAAIIASRLIKEPKQI